MKIFVSYSSLDRQTVTELVSDLIDLEQTVWYDQRLYGGQEWWNEILRQIRECEVFLPVLSPNYLKSNPCRIESRYADNLSRYIFPIRIVNDLEVTSVPQYLMKRQIEKLLDIPSKADYKQLRKTLRHISTTDRPKFKPLPVNLPRPPKIPSQNDTSAIEQSLDQQILAFEEQQQIVEALLTLNDQKINIDKLISKFQSRFDIYHSVFIQLNNFQDKARISELEVSKRALLIALRKILNYGTRCSVSYLDVFRVDTGGSERIQLAIKAKSRVAISTALVNKEEWFKASKGIEKQWIVSPVNYIGFNADWNYETQQVAESVSDDDLKELASRILQSILSFGWDVRDISIEEIEYDPERQKYEIESRDDIPY